MFISYDSPSVRLTGRWYDTGKAVTTTAPGAYFEAAFSGDSIRLYFDISDYENPYPHLYIRLDGGKRMEVPVDKYLRVEAGAGEHTLEVIYKSANEDQARWYAPLVGKVSFLGFEADAPAELAPDNRPFMEFVGDSITEGILIDPQYHYDDENPSFRDRPLQDDCTAGYAWRTAEALGYRPVFMGYGAVGATRSGSGKVPAAPEAYPFCYENAPISHKNPAVIVVNHGANDRRNAEIYPECYKNLLDVIRAHNPESRIVCLSPFCGCFDDVLPGIVADYNATRNADVALVLSTGWVTPEPLHPLRDGHKTIAENFVRELEKIIGQF